MSYTLLVYYLAYCLLVADVVTSECMDGWTTFGNSCYYFGRDDVTFQDAQHFCEHYHSNLVNINTHTELAFLRSFLSELKAPRHWIGMTDELIEGVWKLYPSEVNVPFLDWGHGEPNNGHIANCGSLWESFGYRMVDDPCAGTYFRAICEKPIETVSVVG